jgi:predicted ArsR family transcriptional regulator
MADVIVTAAGLRIIRLLVGQPPQTVSELATATGVTRTAVTEQLNDLLAGGFAERITERLPGRGRPHHLYRATSAAHLLLFADHQRLVAPALWAAINEVGGEELSARILRRASLMLADYYKSKITGTEPEERLRQMVSVLCHDGALIDLQSEGAGLQMHKRSCGFFSLFEPRRSICMIDEMVMSEVVGRPVRQVASRHDGAPCCVFEIVPESGSKGR